MPESDDLEDDPREWDAPNPADYDEDYDPTPDDYYDCPVEEV